MSSTNYNNDKTQIASLESNTKKTSNIRKQNLLGKKISGRYLIEEQIGQGGMCYIYRARDTFLENSNRSEASVAIKVLQEEFSSSEEAISLLKDETSKTQQLSHPSIVKVYSADSDGDLYYVTMELIEGETLEQIIKRSRPSGLAFKKAKIILEQLTDALIYAHSRGIIHNDLKPSNIIFDSNGNLKVLDFGIAKHKTIEDQYAVKNESALAAIGGYTPTYASPEQLEDGETSVKDDVFSFACIVYELLSSKHPFNRLAANKVPKNTKIKKPKNCPLLLWQDLNKALSLNANQRLSSLLPIAKTLKANLKPVIIASLTSIALLLLVTQNYFASSQSIKKLQAKLDNAKAINQQVGIWMSWQGASIIEKLGEIPPQYDVLKQGLLKVNQASVLASFNNKANQVSNSPSNKFKDFDKVIAIYSGALEYYPDSEALSQQLESVLRERQSIILDMTARINLLLEQSRYSENQPNSIVQLIKSLKEVDKSYIYQPTAEYFNNFKIALDIAIENDDIIAQKTLLNIGKVVFSTNNEAKNLLTNLIERESAINALTSYQKKLNQGVQAVFPTSDAIIFYGPKFQRYTEKLKSIEEYKALIEFETFINSESEKLPKDFSLLISLKKELSKRYITSANNLMKKRMYKTAQKLVARSDAITQSLDSIL